MGKRKEKEELENYDLLQDHPDIPCQSHAGFQVYDLEPQRKDALYKAVFRNTRWLGEG